MDTTASRKRMTDEAASRFSEEDKQKKLSPVTTLEIDEETPNGKRYVGKFRYRVPTLGDIIDIGNLYSRYIENANNPDQTAEALAYAFAFLHVTIKDDEINPAWWKESNRGVDLYHSAPIFKLYRLAIEYQARYLGKPVEVGEMKKSAESGSNEDGPRNVGGDISATPERQEIMRIDGTGGVRTNRNG